MARPKTFIFTALASVAVLSVLYISQQTTLIQQVHPYLPHSLQSIMSYSLVPGLKGWHARAIDTPHKEPNTYEPKYENLVFVALQNAQAIPEGFSLAIFKHDDTNENVAIDAVGRVLDLKESDYAGLVTLAQKISRELPDTGAFRNTWVIEHAATSQPIDRLLVKGADDGKLKQTSVQGWSETKKELRKPVGEFTKLPEELDQFAELVLEARDGFEWKYGQPDPEIVKKVKAIVPDEF